MHRDNVGAPFEAFFNIDRTGDKIVAHTFGDMMAHVGNAISRLDPRFRGYLVVVSGNMIVAEVNQLGIKPATRRLEFDAADQNKIADEGLHRRMMAAQESERAERGEPYDERKGG